MSGDGPIFHKYNVDRVDGAEGNPESKHFGGCFLFVLDVDHDPYACRALAAYADACQSTHPQLAAHLRSRCSDNTPAREAAS